MARSALREFGFVERFCLADMASNALPMHDISVPLCHVLFNLQRRSGRYQVIVTAFTFLGCLLAFSIFRMVTFMTAEVCSFGGCVPVMFERVSRAVHIAVAKRALRVLVPGEV